MPLICVDVEYFTNHLHQEALFKFMEVMGIIGCWWIIIVIIFLPFKVAIHLYKIIIKKPNGCKSLLCKMKQEQQQIPAN